MVALCACRGGKLYLQASGWRVAKKDRIDLELSSLKDAQGLYTCLPAVEGGKAFSCCLEVKEDMQITRQVFLVPDSFPHAGWLNVSLAGIGQRHDPAAIMNGCGTWTGLEHSCGLPCLGMFK